MATTDFDIQEYRALVGADVRHLEETLGVALAGAIQCSSKTGSVTIGAVPDGMPVPDSRAGPGAAGVIFVPLAQYPWYLDLLRNEGTVSCHLDLNSPTGHHLSMGLEPVGETETRGQGATAPPDLRDWLDAHPRLRSALFWNGSAYAGWDDQERADLAAAFDAAWHHRRGDAPPDPPDNVAWQSPFEPTFRQVLRGEDAWRLFVGYAGHSLAVEASQRLPWSIAGWTTGRLAYLLDGRQMFSSQLDGFEIVGDDHGWAVPCPAYHAWTFLLGSALVRSTPLATLGRVLEWCRDNLSHFTGPATFDNFAAHWQYRGFPPISRVIGGTTGPSGPGHWTAGCWGTTGFLKALLRAVNIPVALARRPDTGAAHAVPTFPSLSRALTHGDDPYNQLVKSALPHYPGEQLLISMSRFDALFGASVPRSRQAANIGLRPRELAVTHLPVRLLQKYCDDQQQHLDHASGSVFETLSSLGRTVEELEQSRLWERMDDKLAALGGCDRLP